MYTHHYGDDGRFASGPEETEPVSGVLGGREVQVPEE